MRQEEIWNFGKNYRMYHVVGKKQNIAGKIGCALLHVVDLRLQFGVVTPSTICKLWVGVIILNKLKSHVSCIFFVEEIGAVVLWPRSRIFRELAHVRACMRDYSCAC